MVEKETRHVRKKKRVAWGRVDEYSDDGGDGGWVDGMEDDEEGGAVQEVTRENNRDQDEYEESEEEESEGEEEIEVIEEEENEN